MKQVELKEVAVGQVVGFGFGYSWFKVEVVIQLGNATTVLRKVSDNTTFIVDNTKLVDVI